MGCPWMRPGQAGCVIGRGELVSAWWAWRKRNVVRRKCPKSNESLLFIQLLFLSLHYNNMTLQF
jgi:hypothetical protein